MRVVFIGASETVVATARSLLDRGHEVVIVDADRDRIDDLSDELSCGFLHGDGGKPEILKEAGPEQTDALLCMTGDDQVNIIAALVGRSLGFQRVVLKITDAEYESICLELGLQDTLLPSRMVGRYLADLIEGHDILELSRTIKGDARLFSFIATKDEAGPVSELELPEGARAICRYREGDFKLLEADDEIRDDDEIVIITHRDNLESLEERWQSAITRNAIRSHSKD